VYAVEVANVAIDRHDLLAARAAYLDAVQLGTYNPFVYRNLALVDIQLGRRAEALSAARTAAELNRFDPANLALVAQLEAGS
jgi:Flp pilus assembly protein TadD